MTGTSKVPSATLRGQLQTIKNNYALVQAGIMFLAQPDASERFDEYFSVASHHPEAKGFGYIRYVFESDDLLSLATNQLRKSVLRNCLKAVSYTHLDVYKRQPHSRRLFREPPKSAKADQQIDSQRGSRAAI